MDIPKYYKYNDLIASGAQPSIHHFETLKEEGFEVIVNISPVSAKNAIKEEAMIVESLKMDYVHFPVDCSNLRPLHYHTFKGIMDGLEDKRVFVHCGGNIKSSNLLHMYHVLEKGWDESQSLKSLKKIQDPEEKWYQFFKKMGMQGLQ